MAILRKNVCFVVVAIICGACAGDRAVEPGPISPSPPESEILTAFILLPDSATIDQGDEFPLGIVIRTQRGNPPLMSDIRFSTSAPLIASVRNGGFVTALAPGTTVISATTVFGGSTYSDSATITVRPWTVLDSVVLKAESDGWEPNSAHVRAGGKVEWRTGVIATSGVTVERIYLLTPNYGVVDSVEITDGKATRRFNSPGIVRYCSNACWDPPEHGVIHVH